MNRRGRPCPPTHRTPCAAPLATLPGKDRRRRLDSAAAILLELDEATGAATIQPLLASPVAAATPPAASSVAVAARRKVMSRAGVPCRCGTLCRRGRRVDGIRASAGGSAAPVVRFSIVPPAAQAFGPSPQTASRDFAVAPDGSFLVYRSADGQLMLRAFDRLDAVVIPGVNSAYMPSVSPDSKWIAYVDDGPKLKKVAVTGGTPVTLATLAVWPRGVAWADEATLVVGSLESHGRSGQGVSGRWRPGHAHHTGSLKGRRRTPAANRSLRWRRGALHHRHDRSAQFASSAARSENRNADRARARWTRRPVCAGGLSECLGDKVMSAVRFDLASHTVIGNAVRVIDGLSATPTSALNAAITDAGTPVFMPTGSAGVPRRLLWVDRRGSETPIEMPARPLELPARPTARRSPSAFAMKTTTSGSGTLARQTFEPADLRWRHRSDPVWTPDGRRLFLLPVARALSTSTDTTSTIRTATCVSRQAPTRSCQIR